MNNHTSLFGTFHTGITLWERFLLLFRKRHVHWDHEAGILSVVKYRGDRLYLLHQEPIEHGDQRNRQLDRWGL